MGDNDYLCRVNLSFTALVVNNQFLSELFFTPAFLKCLLKYKLLYVQLCFKSRPQDVIN